MRFHVDSVYGFYHGQDPRTFTPDPESCTEKEIAHHKAMCELAEKNQWSPDDSGCHHINNENIQAVVCKTSMGIGIYHVVLDEQGNYLRDASVEDMQRGEWEQ